ncbi:hypothetical protein [Kibdelosporangium aridum]
MDRAGSAPLWPAVSRHSSSVAVTDFSPSTAADEVVADIIGRGGRAVAI